MATQGNKPNQIVAGRIIDLIGGDETLRLIGAHRVESAAEGVLFHVTSGRGDAVVYIREIRQGRFAIHVRSLISMGATRTINEAPTAKLRDTLILLLAYAREDEVRQSSRFDGADCPISHKAGPKSHIEVRKAHTDGELALIERIDDSHHHIILRREKNIANGKLRLLLGTKTKRGQGK